MKQDSADAVDSCRVYAMHARTGLSAGEWSGLCRMYRSKGQQQHPSSKRAKHSPLRPVSIQPEVESSMLGTAPVRD